MAKLEFTMATGERFYRSKMITLGRPYDGFATVKVDLDGLSGYEYFPDDDGNVLFSRHIVSARVVNGVPNRTSETAAQNGPLRLLDGVCECCGQLFVDRTRKRPDVGNSWQSFLASFQVSGVCPRCYHQFGVKDGLERSWTPREWEDWGRKELARCDTVQNVADLMERHGEMVAGLMGAADERKGELERQAALARRREAEKQRLEEQRQAQEEEERRQQEWLKVSVHCCVCGKRVHKSQTSITDRGSVCDTCYGSHY